MFSCYIYLDIIKIFNKKTPNNMKDLYIKKKLH